MWYRWGFKRHTEAELRVHNSMRRGCILLAEVILLQGDDSDKPDTRNRRGLWWFQKDKRGEIHMHTEQRDGRSDTEVRQPVWEHDSCACEWEHTQCKQVLEQEIISVPDIQLHHKWVNIYNNKKRNIKIFLFFY